MNFTLKYGNTQSYQFNMKKETESNHCFSSPTCSTISEETLIENKPHSDHYASIISQQRLSGDILYKLWRGFFCDVLFWRPHHSFITPETNLAL